MPRAPDKAVRLQVLLDPVDAARFHRYCEEFGHKKSTLAARLIRQFLDRESYPEQRELFDQQGER